MAQSLCFMRKSAHPSSHGTQVMLKLTPSSLQNGCQRVAVHLLCSMNATRYFSGIFRSLCIVHCSSTSCQSKLSHVKSLEMRWQLIALRHKQRVNMSRKVQASLPPSLSLIYVCALPVRPRVCISICRSVNGDCFTHIQTARAIVHQSMTLDWVTG